MTDEEYMSGSKELLVAEIRRLQRERDSLAAPSAQQEPLSAGSVPLCALAWKLVDVVRKVDRGEKLTADESGALIIVREGVAAHPEKAAHQEPEPSSDLPEALDGLRAIALDIFDGPETAQDVRDVIEWYASSIRVLTDPAINTAPQPSADRARLVARLSESRILQIANEWAKAPGWCDFERNDFICCARAIVAESALAASEPAPDRVRMVEEAKLSAAAYASAVATGEDVQEYRTRLHDVLDRLAASEPAPDRVRMVEEAGLSIAQEPKYTVNGSAIVNRASGEEIPADEPVFIFRARDVHASWVLKEYAVQCGETAHTLAVIDRIADFDRFAIAHPERMKQPDTAASEPKPQENSNG